MGRITDLFAEPWIETPHDSRRWVRWFAWRPVRTLDAGWIIGRLYWRHQHSWGWGFWDDFPYLNKEGMN